jgi:HD-GYP domain-containing protein (c-di-GMP phosphodiesterase class II)
MNDLQERFMGLSPDFYKSITLESLSSNTMLGFGLYIRYHDNFVLYKSKGSPITEQDLLRLQLTGVTELHVLLSELRDYNMYVEETLSEIMSNPNVAPDVRARIVYQASSNYIDEVFNDPENLKVDFARAKNLVENMIQLVMDDRATMEDLSAVVSHHYYTYVHSVQVASLTLALTNHAFTLDRDELVDVGIGALLHDIGKIFVPKSILEKPGKLDPYEWELIQKHPTLGHDYLKEHIEMSELSLGIVLHHHEKFNGRGYPIGLENHQIGRSSSLCSIADVYCALTTTRAYRDALSPAESVKIMEEEMAGSFNPIHLDILKDLMKEQLAQDADRRQIESAPTLQEVTPACAAAVPAE